ncbi:hypothetical protein KGQ19_00715 [Catenulispora sp. NL8]|uniref:Uncharacterized protein n=1 Tax=Catenulispora pinistramenti TaxID=2705254 RepID=A0ABS5KJ74_9ACTN|nr:hypothetical protein [Catenulispora pinistramenti]MBS2545381.1 hypothetical protein [Catenulispora pinistramenti]
MIDLPALLREWLEDHGTEIRTLGADVEIFESPADRPKRSFGVSLQLGTRVTMLTVWDSAEMNWSSMDLTADGDPEETYEEGVTRERLRAVAESLVDWLQEG